MGLEATHVVLRNVLGRQCAQKRFVADHPCALGVARNNEVSNVFWVKGEVHPVLPHGLSKLLISDKSVLVLVECSKCVQQVGMVLAGAVSWLCGCTSQGAVRNLERAAGISWARPGLPASTCTWLLSPY